MELKDELRELEAQVRKMTLEKEGVKKWVRIETEKVERLKAIRDKMQMDTLSETAELRERQKDVQALLKDMSKKDVEASHKLSVVHAERQKITIEREAFFSMVDSRNKELDNKSNQLAIKENKLIVREKFMDKVFKTILELNNDNSK